MVSRLRHWPLTPLAPWINNKMCRAKTPQSFFKYENMAKTFRMYTRCGFTFFFSFFPRSHFFILWSRCVGTGSQTYYSRVCVREKWMIASFSSCGCDKGLCDVTWLWLLGYQGFCFDSISMLTRSHHLASHTLAAFWLLCDSKARPSFLPSLDCTLMAFRSFCLSFFLLSFARLVSLVIFHPTYYYS